MADLLDAAIKTSTANIGLLKLDVRMEGVLEAVGSQLSQKGVRAVIAPQARKDVILASLDAVARNPKVWTGFGEADLVQPLIIAVFEGLATDKTALLTGPAMVKGVRAVLTATALRGKVLIDAKVKPEQMKQLISLGLKKVEQEIGRAVDAENLPDYLQRLVAFFLDDPFELDKITDEDFKGLHELAIGRAELAEAGEND